MWIMDGENLLATKSGNSLSYLKKYHTQKARCTDFLNVIL